jgi:hypothetical protein
MYENFKSTIVYDVMSCGPVKFTDISENGIVSFFGIEF